MAWSHVATTHPAMQMRDGRWLTLSTVTDGTETRTDWLQYPTQPDNAAITAAVTALIFSLNHPPPPIVVKQVILFNLRAIFNDPNRTPAQKSFDAHTYLDSVTDDS